MSASYPLSQNKFDQMEELICKIKRHARDENDTQLWRMADHLGFLLRDFVTALIVEGSLPEPAVPKHEQETSDREPVDPADRVKILDDAVSYLYETYDIDAEEHFRLATHILISAKYAILRSGGLAEHGRLGDRVVPWADGNG